MTDLAEALGPKPKNKYQQALDAQQPANKYEAAIAAEQEDSIPSEQVPNLSPGGSTSVPGDLEQGIEQKTMGSIGSFATLEGLPTGLKALQKIPALGQAMLGGGRGLVQALLGAGKAAAPMAAPAADVSKAVPELGFPIEKSGEGMGGLAAMLGGGAGQQPNPMDQAAQSLQGFGSMGQQPPMQPPLSSNVGEAKMMATQMIGQPKQLMEQELSMKYDPATVKFVLAAMPNRLPQ